MSSFYKSFLQCLQEQSPEPDPILSSIVYSPAVNYTAFTAVLQASIRNRRFNTVSTPKPAIIITPTKESHVQAVVKCAKKLGVQIKIRSGGHDYDGRSYVSNEKNFIVLDMFKLHDVKVDSETETAVVQTGAQLGELYYRIWEKSKVHGFPAGVCPTVGVGGHVSGGGYGTMIRKYGLSVDQVIDARIVDVNGRILDRKSMGEDLFWAIRGGGGASFGVVLSYTVKIVRVPEINTVFKITKSVAENATDLVYKWQAVAPVINRELFIRVILMPVIENSRTTVHASFIAHFMGDSNKLLDLMNTKFPELAVKKEDCLELSWAQSVLYWANLDYKLPEEILLERNSDTVNFLTRKSDYVQNPISKSGWVSIFNKLAELGKCGFYLNPYGGRMDELPESATPCPHRAGNLFKIQYSMNWVEDDPSLEEKYLNQTRVLYAFMTKYVSKNPRCSYLNYRDLDIGVMTGTGVSAYNSGKMYFKGNFDRLVKVKTAVDPDNFFRNEQSIPPLHEKSLGIISCL
ncbi:berberine bridge enzyme-like 21 [Rutidosis leptorrhynchoides]|uniref:berberine bridge enzyme-like 21 n=1 Tax=Rutidosis leptorrhynchoides TaxID=125765 RepID=UPI003A99DACE